MSVELPITTGSAEVTDHSQWRVERMQLVNWGGFHGRHEIEVAPGSTLMSGASGSGKSTVLDAYIALMMPSNTPFNGASNDAGGRARSAEQRNLLTYLRGKMDRARVAGSDEVRDHVLRGRDGGPIWGALGCTFINDDGRRYTVLRIYFVRAGAKLNGDVTMTFATFDGYLDLSRLEPLAAARFDKRQLKVALPGLSTFNTYWEFEDHVHVRLGIGTGGSGKKAMRLLSRVQAGMEVKRVDDLYKTMVLEEPVTYAEADRALEHFADLDAAYEKMLDEAAKVKALERLPQLQDDLAEAEAKVDLITQFGAETDGPSPFRLWQLRTERGLLEAAVAQNRRDHTAADAAFRKAEAEEADHNARLAQIVEDKRTNGGGAIEERRRRIEGLNRDRDRAYRANLQFQNATEAVKALVPETTDEFDQLRAESAEFLAGFEQRRTALHDEEQQLQDELAPLTTERHELLGERSSLNGRAGMVPRRMHEARVRMAEAAGLDPMEDLPFVAELIDVLPEEGQWRKAVETTLGGLARTMLVDREVRRHLSASIDQIVVRPRINFQAVTVADHQQWRGNPDYVSSKLAFKESRFSQWIQNRVSSRGVDHRCVLDAASLDDREACVTLSGQTRHGDRGAHGESGDGNIIGFSNERRLADIEAALTELDPRIDAMRTRIQAVQTRRNDLLEQNSARQQIAKTAWVDIDHLGIERRIAEIEQEIARLRATNQKLDELESEEERLKPLLAQANNDRVMSFNTRKALQDEWGDLVSEQDDVQDAIDQIEDAQSADVTDDQQAYLDKLVATNWETVDVKSFSSTVVRPMRTRLRDEAEAARRIVRSTTGAMEQMFTQYQARWPENNLGTSCLSTDGYREILDRIRSEGLHERRDRWRREFATWSSDDLLRLNEAFNAALEDIENRLGPVNRILDTLPFGGKGILQIHLRHQHSDDVNKFRRTLKELSSGVNVELTDQQFERKFRTLREFMDRLRSGDGPSKSGAVRDRYLDVRRHVVITAVCLDENHREVATYDSLGDKSGGETQELVAFIVGSALRYQLGDESRSRPRFAPVFLDEGFVKSDSEFAGRAVRAWQSLGFQLFIGAPLDKVTALEPYMELLLQVTKGLQGFSYVNALPDAPADGVDAA